MTTDRKFSRDPRKRARQERADARLAVWESLTPEQKKDQMERNLRAYNDAKQAWDSGGHWDRV